MATKIPNDLKFYRMKRGLTQRQLIEQTGLKSYPFFEGGWRLPDVGELMRVARALRVTRHQLYPAPVLEIIERYGKE